MKSILTTLIALALCLVGFAQQADKALSRVSYRFMHIQDTTQKDRPYTENMLLVIGKNASVYTSYDNINQTQASIKYLQEQMKNQAGNANMSINVNKTGLKPTSKIDHYYFAKENKFFTKERVFNNYLVDEPITKISWKITRDTASFSGIHCQKATAYFKGRNWIAWYAPELPFQSGPWKLNGLPGLIIEAYDEKKEVQFQFAGMENVNEGNTIKVENKNPKTAGTTAPITMISTQPVENIGNYLGTEIRLPKDAILTTRKEIDKLKEARDKDPQGFMKAQMAGSTSTIVVTGFAMPTTGKPAETRQAIVLNNPIELPEKK